MPRILIIYATREGQTGKVAREIAGHLRQAGADVQLLDAREAIPAAQVDVGFFDLLVFGASMHAGGLERELVGFVNARAADIRTKRRSLFLVLLSAATRDPGLRSQSLAAARAKMNAQLQVPFEETEMIAGALKDSRYPLPLRWLMKRIAAKAGGDTDTSRDYEYTDWAQVEAYARRLADACEMNCYKTVHR
jgi:menaquinone-dependent protoporphyrinogen oxidase